MIKTKKTANVSREFMPMPKIFVDTQVSQVPLYKSIF